MAMQQSPQFTNARFQLSRCRKGVRLPSVFDVPKVLSRKLRTFLNQVTANGVANAVPLAYARLNKLDLVQFGIRGAILPFRVKLRKQLDRPPPGLHEVTVLSVVRNGLPWLHTFLLHHRELGAKRFVILDNGSTDGTLQYLLAQDDVTLLTSDAPYKHYENTFKRYLCDRFARGRWCLFVDVDELLAYPGMERRSLDELARFAGEAGLTGIVTQMLDLYSEVPMAEMPDGAGRDVRPICRYYELEDIEKAGYRPHPSNDVPDNLCMHSGGVRKRVFGTRNCLTKVSLFLNGEGLVPFHSWHQTRGARIAPFSTALLHYPFNRQYRDKVREAASSGRYGWVTNDEYRAYAAVLEDNPQLSMMSAASILYEGPEQLVADAFLETTPAFDRWAADGRD